jgi:hypothetical protein
MILADVYGYIDPGSGSLLFQLLISGVVGFIAVIKIYWHKIKLFFRYGGRGGADTK